MTQDRYTLVILTIIAISLAVIAIKLPWDPYNMNVYVSNMPDR